MNHAGESKTQKILSGSAADAVALGATKQLRLDIVPVVEGKKLTVNVTWEGQPVAGAEVVVKGGGVGGDKLKTDDKGQVSVDLDIPGLLEIRARHVEAKAGKLAEKEYSEVRHYCTVTLPWGETK